MGIRRFSSKISYIVVRKWDRGIQKWVIKNKSMGEKFQSMSLSYIQMDRDAFQDSSI